MAWHIRNAEGRIIGHKDTCAAACNGVNGIDADGNCATKAAEGSIFCTEHEPAARSAWASDRQGHGIKI